MHMVDNGNLGEVELLLESGADPDSVCTPDTDCLIMPTALHAAVWGGHDKIAELLLQYGATVDIQMRDGETPLIEAARENLGEYASTCIVRLLLSYGADPAASFMWRGGPLTALVFARSCGNDSVGYLLRWALLITKIRFAGRVAATLLRMLRESTDNIERLYAPGGRGCEAASESFNSLQISLNGQRDAAP